MSGEEDVRRLAENVSQGNVVVLTGAGMSTESGLPDFRSSGGLWAGKDPMKIASAETLLHHFDEFTEFYRKRIRDRRQYSPHAGHYILAEWEERGWVRAVVTQNVDGYHREAGSREVYEIHGSLTDIYCDTCRTRYDEEAYLQEPYCRCQGRLRPGIVLFGEMLPADAFQSALEAVRSCDTLLVIGTSLQVAPANMLPVEAVQSGAEVFLINNEAIEDAELVDCWLQGSAKEVLSIADEIVKRNR